MHPFNITFSKLCHYLVLFIIIFQFCLLFLLSVLSVLSVYLHVTPTHSLSQAPVCIFPPYLAHSHTLSLMYALYTVLTQTQSAALWSLDACVRAVGCGGTVVQVAAVTSHLFPLLGCCSTDEVSCAGKAC